jgi:hypothetical protein
VDNLNAKRLNERKRFFLAVKRGTSFGVIEFQENGEHKT